MVLGVGETCHQSADPAASGQMQCVAGVFSYQQILDIRAGLHMHQLGAYATIACRCKSKSNILTNMALRTGAVKKIEESGFEVQAICHQAPSLGLALVGRYRYNAEGEVILIGLRFVMALTTLTLGLFESSLTD